MSTRPVAPTDTSTHVETDTNARHAGHPGPRQYIAIAVILAVITAIEVAVYYIGALESVHTPIYIVLSISKFALVAMFFMHLKFDSRFFSAIFVTGLLLAVGVFLVFLTMIRVFFV
jgi:cytochrome c oxidase subunit 4